MPWSVPSRETTLKRELGLRDLTLFVAACVIGPRWISVAAGAGPGSIVLWIAAAVLFAGPLGAAVNALIAKHPGTGGLYRWAREDFGPFHGFLCFWVYWFGITLTVPSSAMFAMSMSAHTLGPEYAYLAGDQTFVVLATLASIWAALFTNLIGMKVGKWTENLGGLTSWALGAMLVALALIVFLRRGSATEMHLLPAWNWGTLRFLGGIAFALSGVEVLGMMAGEIKNPQCNVVPATWMGTASSTAFYIASTLALLVLLQPGSIDELHGLAAGVNTAAEVLTAPWITPLAAAIVVVNSVGGWGGWGSAVSRMPYAAGVDHLLPPSFARLHPRWATPYVAILWFGGVASFLLIVIQFGDTLRAGYQTLLSLMVLVGFLPYFYVFAGAWKCGRKAAAISGSAMTALTVISSAIPGEGVTNVWAFEGKLAAGAGLMIGSAWLVYQSAGRR
jgi:APA family basic amino acid/polyamine antiporter